jgi:hypothetical protein
MPRLLPEGWRPLRSVFTLYGLEREIARTEAELRALGVDPDDPEYDEDPYPDDPRLWKLWLALLWDKYMKEE